MEDEAFLVERMKNGDRSAFDQIYERYQNRILRMAYLIVGNISDSEDIAQETFIKCFLHCAELKDSAGFKSWLFQILTRTAWNYAKKKSRELPDEEIEKKAERSNGITILDHILASEQSSEIISAIRTMDMKYRLVLVYYYYNQMSTKEIANVCRCFEGTVKSRLFTARRILKEMLNVNKQEEPNYEQAGQFRQTNHASAVSGR